MIKLRLMPEIERTLESMAVLAPVAARIKQMARHGEPDMQALLATVAADPMLTVKVMRLVNSSFYGLADPIRSLDQAVVLLGARTVQNLALSAPLLTGVPFALQDAEFSCETFWRHTYATGLTSQCLALAKPELADWAGLAFMGGLLHDVGKLLFIHAQPEQFRAALVQSRQSGVALTFGELAFLGCPHMQAGGFLGRKWQVDAVILEVIEQHHDGRAAFWNENPLLPLVILGNNLCKYNGVGSSGNAVIEEVAEECAVRLGIDETAINSVMNQMWRELKKAEAFLGLEASPKDGQEDRRSVAT